MSYAPTVTLTDENIEVECTHCHMRMTPHMGSGQRIKYFRCACCHRWVSSNYTEVFRADTHVRTHRVQEPERAKQFEAVKDRLERWLQALDDQDPYRTLGVTPLDSAEAVRARYHELALENHPDRGGSAEKMRELNLAYERIVSHRERRRAEALSAGAVASAASLPEMSR